MEAKICVPLSFCKKWAQYESLNLKADGAFLYQASCHVCDEMWLAKCVQMGIAPLMKKPLKCGNLWESRLKQALTRRASTKHKVEKIVLHIGN